MKETRCHASIHSVPLSPDAFKHTDLLRCVGGSEGWSDVCFQAVSLELVARKFPPLSATHLIMRLLRVITVEVTNSRSEAKSWSLLQRIYKLRSTW